MRLGAALDIWQSTPAGQFPLDAQLAAVYAFVMRLKDHAPSVERIAKSVGWIPRAVVEDTFDCPGAAVEVHMPKAAVGIDRHRIPNANLRGLTRWKRPGFEG